MSRSITSCSMIPFDAGCERPARLRHRRYERAFHESGPASGVGHFAIHRVAVTARGRAYRTRRSLLRDLDRPDALPRDGSPGTTLHSGAFATAHFLAAVRGSAVHWHADRLRDRGCPRYIVVPA